MRATARRRSPPTSSPRPTACRTCSRSMCCSRKRACGGPARADAAGIMVVPLFETIADLQRAPEIMARMARPARGRAEDGDARLSGGDGRLFRFEQGWRLSHLGVEPAPGEPGARLGVRDRRGGDAVVPRPRRRGRARRRIELRGDPRAAARDRPGPDPDHRAGRGDRRQIWQRAKAPPSISRR